MLSDIHSNAGALCRVLEDMATARVDRIISLGDNVGYGLDPCGVIQLLRAHAVVSTLGNHELALLDTDYRKKFRGRALQAIRHNAGIIPREDLDFIRTFPFFLVTFGARFVHGMPPDAIMADLIRTPDRRILKIMELLPQSLSFVGHTHLPGMIEMKRGRIKRRGVGGKILFLDKANRYIINAGSVGQSRDGDASARYLLWDVEAFTVEFRRVVRLQPGDPVHSPGASI